MLQDKEHESRTFEDALKLPLPWQIASHHFDPKSEQLYIDLTFPKDAVFSCANCGAEYQPVYDIYIP